MKPCQLFVLGSYVQAQCLLLERLPTEGESLAATGLISEHGGKGLNVAIAAKRLGAQVETLIGLGEDPAAENLRQFFQQQGLSTQGLVSTGPQSGYGVGFIAADGSNFLAIYPGANALVTAAHVDAAYAALAAADMVCAQFEIAEAAIVQAFQHARALAIPTCLNPSPWHTPSEELLAVTDIVIVNASEAALLLAQPPLGNDVEAWLACLPTVAWQGQLLVITLADQGCVAWHNGEVCYQPAFTITAQDATGAGDAFTAALAVALATGKSLAEALVLAAACGAWVAARLGVLQALPNAEEILAFINTYSN